MDEVTNLPFILKIGSSFSKTSTALEQESANRDHHRYRYHT